MIEAAGLVIPARDEEESIGRCLRAVRRSLVAVLVPVVVCLVADRCTDATADAARAAMPEVEVVTSAEPLSLGEVRALGMTRALDLLGDRHPGDVWLLGTDADTAVGASWVASQLAHADTGADAVTGLVELESSTQLTDELRRRYQELVAAGIRPLDHDHVHGANFGVRASAYQAVGGYRPLATGEDRDLWFRLRDAGHVTRQPHDLDVVTSSRLHGRATGGLADLLAGLLS